MREWGWGESGGGCIEINAFLVQIGCGSAASSNNMVLTNNLCIWQLQSAIRMQILWRLASATACLPACLFR